MRRLAVLVAVLAAAVGCAAGSQPSAGPARLGHAVAPAGSAAHAKHPGIKATGIKHVFLIVLENESYTATFVDNPNPYLGKRLPKQGTILTNYYAIGHSSLDNYLAMISGQAPNNDTSADCARYNAFNGTTARATVNADGQAVGTGCVYPHNVKTLADQLSAHHVSWGGYMDQMGNTPGREAGRCGVPLTKFGFDDTQTATPQDQYAARHNPFVYFHSLIDSGLCRHHVVPLTSLPKALRHTRTTPAFSFITPDLCNDGHDKPCKGADATGSSAGGLVSADHFLATWVPRIEHSPAFKKNGLLLITSDESLGSDATSCCNEKPGPSDPRPGRIGPGGGRIGALAIGTCVARGATDPKHYNHYSLLRSLEDLYGIRHGGTDGKGHLGYAAAKGLRAFGPDLFKRC